MTLDRNSPIQSGQSAPTFARPNAPQASPTSVVPVALKDGAVIQTWIHAGVGTPIVMLYGLGCSKQHWKYQSKHLKSTGRLVIELDYRGHGMSTLGLPKRPLSVVSLAHDVIEVLKTLGVSQAVFCGQSMGSTVAIQVAHDAPELASGLVLQGPPVRPGRVARGVRTKRLIALLGKVGTVSSTLSKSVSQINRTFYKLPVLAREIVRQHGFNAELAKTEDIEEYLSHFYALDPIIFYELAASLQIFDLASLPMTIDLPTLIIAGEKDQIVPLEDCRWLARRLPGADLVVVPHGSHCPHLEDPSLINQHLMKFLRVYDL